MQQNYVNNYPNQPYPALNPNAVNINIYSPQAYGQNGACQNTQNTDNCGYYSMYGTNTMPNLPLYPQNYNTPINYNYAQNPLAANPNNSAQYPYRIGYPANPNYAQAQVDTQNQTPASALSMAPNNNQLNERNSVDKVSEKTEVSKKEETDKKKEKEKTITPLTDDYIKNLENYLNSNNSKIRLIGIKEVMERFKEDENRKDNPSLVALLNKALQDTSASVRFIAMTALQLGYSVGDSTTVQLLTKIANENLDKFGQDALLASEILLKLSAPSKIKVKEGEN